MNTRDLADVLDDLYQTGNTGVLSVSIKNDNHQLKFFLRNGSVYSATYSSCKNLDCLANLTVLETERCFFMPGVKMDALQAMKMPMEEVVQRIRNLRKTVEYAGPAGVPQNGPAAHSGSPSGGDAGLARLEEELLSLIGPIAHILFDDALQQCNVKKGSMVTGKTLHAVALTLAPQIPEEHRKTFLAKFSL